MQAVLVDNYKGVVVIAFASGLIHIDDTSRVQPVSDS